MNRRNFRKKIRKEVYQVWILSDKQELQKHENLKIMMDEEI